MESVQKGLRAGDLEKDTYDRLRCASCEEELGRRSDSDEVGAVRVCPECDSEWRQL
jgi:DNA-directed RNA polymerase subunit RPC12/RpoP